MDEQYYQELIQYKQTKNPTVEQLRKFKNLDKRYNLRQRRLIRIRKDGKELLVILRTELEALLRAIHDAPFGGHLGSSTMEEKVKGKYWWPNFITDIRNHVKCAIFAKEKENQEKINHSTR